VRVRTDHLANSLASTGDEDDLALNGEHVLHHRRNGTVQGSTREGDAVSCGWSEMSSDRNFT
jgi:hypothetical protein